MSVSETDIANLALGKIGGAGEENSGNAFISSIDDDDKISQWCKLNFPRVRRKVISDLAARKCPFRATVRFLDPGAALDSYPEIGEWQYAFNLPGDCLEVTRQFYESAIRSRAAYGPVIYENQWETIANSSGSGLVFLTDTLSNLDGDGVFIEYVFDNANTGSFTESQIDCIATLLASEVCPMVGKDIKTSNDMMVKYIEVMIPNAQRANQRGFNNHAKVVPDYSGGRTGGITFPAVNTGLGTYLSADGTRVDI